MPPPTALILSIGDELVSGQTTNTNATWLSQQLAALGIATAAHVTVGDQLLPIVTAIRDALDRHTPLLLITGGLGPTLDDLTRQALADALHEQLVEDPSAVIQIEAWFKSKNRPMSPSNRLQALRPHSAEILDNPTGTAPGLFTKKDHTSIFVMPGVPKEMRAMFTTSLLPRLRLLQPVNAPITLLTKINTFGRGESVVGEALHHLMTRNAENPNLSVGTTVHDGIVSVRIYATGSPADATALTEQTRTDIHARLGPIIFSEGDTPLQSAVADLLKEFHHTLATAESCTGGLLATLLTDIPGSSAYFLRGWITYANAAKYEELSISESLLAQHGAVSEPIARAMAEAARKFGKSDYALATTGIAGPDGGTDEKPVGTVWIALATPTDTLTRKFIFPGDRTAIRLRAAQMALALLRWNLLGIQPPI
jgi:nicotinamide-nucleotide amidase